MKVLMIAPYIYKPDMKEFTKNNTGLGIMISKTAESISEKEDVILLSRVITKGNSGSKDNYRILKHTWKDVFFSAGFKGVCGAIKKFIVFKANIKEKVRQAFFILEKGFISKTIKAINPDVIHIHCIGTIMQSYRDVCDDMNIKYISTLHGLIGLDETVKAPAYDKQTEVDFLKKSVEEEMPVSVISSGIKARIEENYLKGNADNIHVVLNGIDVEKKLDNNENEQNRMGNGKDIITAFEDYYYKKLQEDQLSNLDSDKLIEHLLEKKKDGYKIAIQVGNITENKNQIYWCKVVNKEIEDMQKNKLITVILGREADGGDLRKYVIDNNLQQRIILAGFTDRVNSFYNISDINIFTSLNDGFGLSIVEGYVYGVPTVTFSDLDAIPDVYNENAMLVADSRDESVFFELVKEALAKEWDRKWIEEYSKKFSLEIMAENYIDLYKRI